MPRTAKQIDFSSNKPASEGVRHTGDDITAFKVKHYLAQAGNKFFAGLGEEGLCNEPMFDEYRKGAVSTGVKFDGGNRAVKITEAYKKRGQGIQWGAHCVTAATNLNHYSCYFLLGIPYVDKVADDVGEADDSSKTLRVVAQSDAAYDSSTSPTKTLSNSRLVNYPYLALERDSSGVRHTYEVYHIVGQAKQIQGLKDLGYRINQNPNDPNEYRMLIDIEGADDPEELTTNLSAWFDTYGDKSPKEKKEIAQDYGVVAKSNEAYLNSSPAQDISIVGNSLAAYLMKTNLVSDIGYVLGSRQVFDGNYGGRTEAAMFNANECNDSSIPLEDRLPDCGGCDGKFAKSPVWPPYKTDDLINVIACADVLPDWPGVFAIAGGPAVACDYMDTNFDARQRVGASGVKGDKGEKGEKGEKGQKGDKGFKGEKGDRGFKGEKGDEGEKGFKGQKGEKGDEGEKGQKGFEGPGGPGGPAGPVGPKGPQGDVGDPSTEPGPEGPSGDKGEKGDKGDKGQKGKEGPKGEKGEKGPKGEKGQKGETDEKEIEDSPINGEKDELYAQALEIIRSEGKASTSFLQRKLQIGYNRAARIIDMMEADGIVSKANHVGKRDVL